MKNILIVTLMISVSLIGCGQYSPKPKNLPLLIPCTLTITQENKPLAGAFVMFEPADEATGTAYMGGGVTDANGCAKITTSSFPGVRTGKFKVTVTKGESPAPGEMWSFVEALYTSGATTPHVLEVTGKEKQVIKTFDVGKAIREKVAY
ncbi:MAG: hypothetical protein LBH00_05935 [Planctomycetaceae bacterium]|nr:hypothetical protein [Planctomycetaceae bacterium]